MLFFKMFKKFEKVVRGGKNWEKWGKNGVKWLSENPQLYTTDVSYSKTAAKATLKALCGENFDSAY